MTFSDTEKALLLQVKGVGPTVVQRLEQLGYGSFVALAGADAAEVVSQAAVLLGASCWKNSPQARAAIAAAIACAREQVEAAS